MKPIPKLDKRYHQRNDKNDDSTKERNDRQNDCGSSNQQCVIKANQQETYPVQNPIGNSDQNLAPEKRYQVALDRVQDENQFIFEGGIRNRQVVGPTRGDAPFLQKKVECI